MKTAALLFFLALLFGPYANANAATLSADDFLPPVQAGNEEAQAQAEKIQQPEAVKEEKGFDDKPAIAAATAQDAVNAAIERLAVAGGCEEVKFPSGFGFVASGLGTYNVMPNPTATLIAQRHAYQVAYMNAKKNLAAYLHGLSHTAQDQLKEEFDTIASDTDTLSNVSHEARENVTEIVRGLLKGYVVYKIADDQDGDTGNVTVSIVATPKTMGKSSRVDTSTITADTLKAGLDEVLAELGSGLLSPVGGKVISVPRTGELAFVGFGSAIVPDNPDKATRAKLALNATKAAQMRARSALCGIILGDDVQSTSTMDSSTKSLSNQFEEMQKEDPTLQAQNESEIRKLEDQRKSFLNRQFNSEQITSMRSGVLPPGHNVKTYFNPEKTMAEAIAVYLPSASARAAKAGQDMENARIVENPNNSAAGGAGTQGQMPARGPSGQVTNDADL